jgi:hypothetical protein
MDELVVVKVVGTEPEAELFCSLLRSAGISPSARGRPLDGTLFVDRVLHTRTLTTWAEFERFHQDGFLERAARIVERFGS